MRKYISIGTVVLAFGLVTLQAFATAPAPYKVICHHTPGNTVTLSFQNVQSYTGHLGTPHNDQTYDTDGACIEVTPTVGVTATPTIEPTTEPTVTPRVDPTATPTATLTPTLTPVPTEKVVEKEVVKEVIVGETTYINQSGTPLAPPSQAQK